MDDENKSHGSENEPINNEHQLHWYGMQLIQRMQGTNEIYTRSFPFWGPSIEWGIGEAKRLNSGPQETRGYWTEVQVHCLMVETKDGCTMKELKIKEFKL